MINGENMAKFKLNFYKLEVEYNLPLKETLAFYGAEVGNDVLVLTVFNSDICTAMFTMKNSELVNCGDNKYSIAERSCSSYEEKSSSINNLEALQDNAITGAIMDKSLELAKKIQEDLEKPIPNSYEDAKQEFNEILKETLDNPVVTAAPTTTPKVDKPAIIVKPVITKGKQEQKTEPAKTTPKPVNRQSVLAETLTEAHLNKKKDESQKQPPKKIKPDKFDPWSGSGW